MVTEEDQSNEELLRRYQNADPRAFDEFFRRTKTLVYGYLLARLKNRGDADDAFQETYFRIHRYIDTFDPSRNALAWVMTIARNKTRARSPVR